MKRAFDSIHRNSLWATLHHNGIPQKIISLIKALCSDFPCRVIHEGSLKEPFLVNFGSLDWVLKSL